MDGLKRLAFCGMVLVAAGCDDEGGDDTEAVDAGAIDAAPAVDASEADAGPCLAPSSFGDAGDLTGVAVQRNQPGSMGARKLYVADFELDPQAVRPDVLELQLWDDYGHFTGGVVAPGTYAIAGDETEFELCGTCVVIYADRDRGTSQALTAFLAQSGTIVIDSVQPTLTGSLQGVSFIEIDPLRGQPVEGSTCTTAIDSLGFSAPVEEIPGGGG